ncbi:hypothetical protein CDL62_05940 [Alkalitalea saponilacus]|nr:hypothetical protein CDL62_05940 [Alkalitalea saponilacus]
MNHLITNSPKCGFKILDFKNINLILINYETFDQTSFSCSFFVATLNAKTGNPLIGMWRMIETANRFEAYLADGTFRTYEF